MPRHRDFALDARPSYGFEVFDALMQELRDAIPHSETLTEVLDALRLEGRQLDVDQLASELQLDADVVEIVKRLASWGDCGLMIHEFATVCVARINAASLAGMCDLTTFVFAQRCDHGFALSFEDENGGHGDLGVYEHPLSLLELIVVIDGVLVVQAPYEVVDADWRSGYFSDPSMTVRVSSTFYEQLQVWYEQAIAEWIVAHSNKVTE